LWFHHLPWDYTMQSGRSLWEELCYKYDEGVKATDEMKKRWSGLDGEINGEQFQQVTALLKIQSEEARWWRNSCLLYFQQFSEMPFPADIEQPEGALEEYMKMRFPYAPGIRPSW
ncbi:MAG: alpha-glucuronidase, partial [Cyclobacteriaceae bacterium]|nr:alpha-glucuronidase [Cyclobacteriaceae bacterium]